MQLYERDAPPYPRYAFMRATSPVYKNPSTGAWEVYSYNDVKRVLGDPGTFSSEVFRAVGLADHQTFANLDPPRHSQLRRLVARTFASGAVTLREPAIRALMHGLLDEVVERGALDLVEDVAYPLPAAVIAGLLGLPHAEARRYRDWGTSVVKVKTMAMRGQVPPLDLTDHVKQLTDHLTTIISERRANPACDLISILGNATIDGSPLPIDEVASTCKMLMVGGQETTVGLIGSALHLLLQDTNSLAAVRESPSLVRSTLDEALRYAAPSQYFGRIVTQDTTLGGERLRAGEWVTIFLGSANRDEEMFVEPDRFDISRTPNPHLSFGHGIHFCLGAPLGLLEAQVALEVLMERLPDLRLDPNRPALHRPAGVQFGPTSLPAVFTPVARLGGSHQESLLCV